MNVIVRPQFYLDIEEEVYWLLENAGADVAQRWHNEVWQTVELLKTHPGIGRERMDIKESGVRSWRMKRFPRWLIFYLPQEDDDVILLLRVKHGMMNLVGMKMWS